MGGRGPVRHADLGVDVLNVVLGRASRDEQLGGDLSRRLATSKETEHLELAPAQATRTLLTEAWNQVAPGRRKLLPDVHGGGVEVEGGPFRNEFAGPLSIELRGETALEILQLGDVMKARLVP